jgi:hypothetical protein
MALMCLLVKMYCLRGRVLAVRRDFAVWLMSLRVYAFSNVETWGLLADGQHCALNHLEKRCDVDGTQAYMSRCHQSPL